MTEIPGLDLDTINKLLKEDAEQQINKRGPRGPKVDLTEFREINVWYKLSHHLCSIDCEHRQDDKNPANGRACWNPNCVDTRPSTDRGTNIVVNVKGQWICRYCFLARYLA